MCELVRVPRLFTSKAMDAIATHYGRVVHDLDQILTSSTQVSLHSPIGRILCYVNGSIPSWRVVMMLSEVGIRYTSIRLKVMSRPKETGSVAFSRINLRCKTPTLIDDGRTLIENMGILQYLERNYGQVSGQNENWVTILTRFHEPENAHYVFEDIELCFEKNLTSAEQDRVVAAVDNTISEMVYWETYVGKEDFIAGNKFSIADCAFYPCVAYLEHRGWDFDGFLALKRYADRVRQRKCAIEACRGDWDKKVKKDLWKRAMGIRNESHRRESVPRFDAKGS